MTENGQQEAGVAGPLTVFGVVLAVYGLLRRSPLALLVGGLAIGAGLKLRPRRSA